MAFATVTVQCSRCGADTKTDCPEHNDNRCDACWDKVRQREENEAKLWDNYWSLSKEERACDPY